ncbi:MAG: hypothetical protein LQ340_003693 [Diploschistes diacapsis]|nr:MAG: hypothetical protein LQ340_003693 [Diploschistes diacapsis]
MGNRTFEHSIFGNHAITTMEPKNIQAILATQFKDFSLGERRRKWLTPLLGVGIFTSDGSAWEHSRAMLRPQFNRSQVSDLKLEEQHIQNMMLALQTNPSSSYATSEKRSNWTAPVDLQVLFFRLTLDSACEFLFGESVDSQIRNLPGNADLLSSAGKITTNSATDEANFAAAFDRGQAWLSMRSRLGPLYWLIDGPSQRRDAKACHDFVDHFVELALTTASPSGRRASQTELEKGDPTPQRRLNASGGERFVFLEALAAQTQDPLELRSQILNILLAGRDTTASLLGWTFYLLARHPDIWAKLRAAVVADFGAYAPNGTASISFSSLKSCGYLQHVLSEVLRLYPVVPINLREAVRDTTLPVGGGEDGKSPVFVRKGQQVDYSVHVMHRLKSLWGEDADEFKPERWAGRKPGWEYLPFNGGPRICIGQQFAITEASYVIVRLLQRFDAVENLDTSRVPTHNLTLTSCPAAGVQVRLREATSP